METFTENEIFILKELAFRGEELPKEISIKILNRVHSTLESQLKLFNQNTHVPSEVLDGICYLIGVTIQRATGISRHYLSPSKLIPVFKLDLAKPFGAMPFPYWWHRDFDGYTKRLEFVDWMIKELKNENHG